MYMYLPLYPEAAATGDLGMTGENEPLATGHGPLATGRLPRATGRFVAVATWHRASATRFVARESGQRQRNGQKNQPGGQFPWIFDEIP